jgi:hypothetical protein
MQALSHKRAALAFLRHRQIAAKARRPQAPRATGARMAAGSGADLTGWTMDEERFVSVLEKLIGEARRGGAAGGASGARAARAARRASRGRASRHARRHALPGPRRGQVAAEQPAGPGAHRGPG